jgi:manganese oxidase
MRPAFEIPFLPGFKHKLPILFCLLPLVAISQTNIIRPTVTPEMGDVGGKSYGKAPDEAKTRHYYIAAEKQLWDFAPEGRDVVCGMPLSPSIQAQHASIKIRYVAYTDATFTKRQKENASLGILGPVLRGVTGENIAVTFWNRADAPLSMHPHGLKYDKDSEGSYYQPGAGRGAAVATGAKFTYVWQLDSRSGPSPSEPSSKAWLYHSHVTGDEEVNLGLVGFIIVTDPARARPDGTPVDVDREFGCLFKIFNESGFDPEAEEAAESNRKADGSPPGKTWSQIQELKEEGERHAINGRIFGNLSGLEMNTGERVRWYLFGLGSENDFHTPHWHGLRVVEGGRGTDVIELLPASMKVADMVADNPGTWLFHCHVADHMMQGMFAPVTVYPIKNSLRRAPEPAFLGLLSEPEPLQIKYAEALIGAASDNGPACKIKIEGEAAIPETFALFKNPVTIQIGGRAITFKPSRDGRDQNNEGTFEAENASRNSSELGMVYGGWLKFKLTLSGNAWGEELVAKGFKASSPGVQQVKIPMSAEIAGVKDAALIQINAANR